MLKMMLCLNAEMLIYVVNGRNVHTCNSSELAITQRVHDDSCTTDISDQLYYNLQGYPVKPNLKFTVLASCPDLCHGLL